MIYRTALQLVFFLVQGMVIFTGATSVANPNRSQLVSDLLDLQQKDPDYSDPILAYDASEVLLTLYDLLLQDVLEERGVTKEDWQVGAEFVPVLQSLFYLAGKNLSDGMSAEVYLERAVRLRSSEVFGSVPWSSDSLITHATYRLMSQYWGRELIENLSSVAILRTLSLIQERSLERESRFHELVAQTLDTLAVLRDQSKFAYVLAGSLQLVEGRDTVGMGRLLHQVNLYMAQSGTHRGWFNFRDSWDMVEKSIQVIPADGKGQSLRWSLVRSYYGQIATDLLLRDHRYVRRYEYLKELIFVPEGKRVLRDPFESPLVALVRWVRARRSRPLSTEASRVGAWNSRRGTHLSCPDLLALPLTN